MATTSNELRCIKYLSNISDPRNRTIPVLDIIPLPDDVHVLVVMPYGRRFNHPAFHCRSEFVEAMRQFLEGLQFMHNTTFAICYFAWKNRCSVGPIDYYYIDFGLSKYCPEGRDAALWTGTLRTFPTIPELSKTVPYNPFKADIFQLGLTMANAIKEYPHYVRFTPSQTA
ncbi:hypothetical protein K438DRAFT_1963311 [Mycena galopus ATCC 62051]|nr:hypothetical protein K438DRAFT_1963311 [Mycena galopus ATCC 62051]